MRISEPRASGKAGWAALSSTVTWEERVAPPHELQYAVSEEYRDALTSGADAFLTGALLAALHHGERRVSIDAAVCPVLLTNLRAVAAYYDRWFYNGERQIEIGSTGLSSPEDLPRRAGVFFSGGVDSLFTLWLDRQTLPGDHPARIRDGLVILGFEIQVDSPHAVRVYENALEALGPVAEEMGIELVPVLTNVRQLEPSGAFWGDVFQGAILASTAHLQGRRCSDVVIAASSDIANLTPYGTHPAVDPHLSSHRVRITHANEEYSRLQKLQAMRDWRGGLDHLRVCPRAPPDRLNCGRCEKCLRVMLGLVAIDRLRDCAAFEASDVAVDQVAGMTVEADVVIFYPELIAALRGRGRPELARALWPHLLRDLPRRLRAYAESALKDVDHQFARDRLRALVRKARGSSRS